MGLRVAVWATGLAEENLSGPWIVLDRLLSAYKQSERGHQLVLFTSSESIGRRNSGNFECRQATKLPIALEQACVDEGCDLVLTNGIPSTVGSLLLHSYFRLPWIAWVHGTLAFVDDYQLGDSVRTGVSYSVKTRWTKAVMRAAARCSTKLIANSGFTRSVLEKSVGSGELPTEVIRAGVDRDSFQPADPQEVRAVQNKFSVPDKFILSVAVANPIKNIRGILKTFSLVIREVEQAHLVIAGEGWTDELVARWIDDSTVRRRVHTLGFVGEKDLIPLYTAAKMLLHPSLHETFGLPLLEAMACGCPVISSNGTAIPEVCGDAAFLVDDPEDIGGLADVVSKVWHDEELRRQMEEAGYERASEFSWSKSADRLEELFDRFERRLRLS